MCDYCDCRSHREIAELSADHEELTRLIGRLRAAIEADDRPAAGVVVAAMGHRLHPHAHREEGGVFAELRCHVGDGYVDMFEQDHVLIHDLLHRAAGDEWRPASVELAAVLGEHILREESDLFPSAHQLLDPDQWSHIDEQRIESRSTL